MKKATKKFVRVSAFAVAVAMSASVAAPAIGAFAAPMQGADGKFSTEFTSHVDVLKEESKLNQQLAAEGFALIKNNNNALPLASTERKITLLGENSYSVQDGGGGSGSASRPGNKNKEYDWISQSVIKVNEALKENGFTINPTVAAKYKGANANGENHEYMTLVESGNGDVELGEKKYSVKTDGYLAGVEESYTEYGGVALINIMRSGSEFTDNAVHGVANHADANEHYLTLNDYERQLFAYAKYQKAQNKLKKIVVLINSASPMEIGDIQDDNAFDAILWTGTCGWDGAKAIGDILKGDVNPSGHLVDFWMRDFTTDPTYYNFGTYEGAAFILSDGATYDHSKIGEEAPQQRGGGNKITGPSVVYDEDSAITPEAMLLTYSEGIFLGYRYYETVAAELDKAKAGEGEKWYDSVTLYPFGYGLSYTSFTQEIKSVTGDITDAAGKLTVTVEVSNTGTRAGKDVVQLYSTPTYHDGGIDKAEVNLISYKKTGTIAAGAKEEVAIEIAVKDLASFDFNDKNKNNNSGYELEADKYILSIRANSHDVLDSEEITATQLLTWDEDGNPATPNNILSQTSGEWEIYNTDVSHWLKSGTDHDLHRNTLLNKEKTGPSDLTELAWIIGEDNDNVFTEKAAAVVKYRESSSATGDFDNHTTVAAETNYNNVWVKTAADMAGKTQGAAKADKDTGLYPITVEDLIGADYDDAKWDELLNQLTWEELVNLAGNRAGGSYANAGLATIGKPKVTDQDGPGQLKANGKNGWFWVGETVIASTWNTDLAYQQGFLVGSESVWNDGAGWYGPAMNNHRTPLSGRNFEYYSQDGIQGGLIAAAVVGGCVDAGGRVYIKHAFLNDQEASRMNGLATFANEQAIREIYSKPFELAIRLGNANGIMSAFPNIGLSSSGSYALNIQLYTNEWGYKGITVTDMYMGADKCGWTADQMVRGCIFPLGRSLPSGTWDDTAKVVKVGETVSYTQWYWVRETVKRMLYVYANSAAGMNGFIKSKAIVTEEVKGTAGTEVDVQLIDVNYLKEFYGADKYNVVFGADLPKGVSYNAATGKITGTPEAKTESTITVGGGWGQPSREEVVNYVDVNVRVSGKDTEGWIGGASTVRITFGPSNAEIAEDITALEKEIADLKKANEALGTKNTELETKINELLAKIDEIQKQEGPKGDKGDKGDPGEKGDKGDPGEAGKGCGGVIGGGAAAVAALAILGGAVLATKKRKED